APLVAYAEGLGPRVGADAVQSVFCNLLRLDRGAIARIKDVRAYLAKAVRHAVLNAMRDAGRTAVRERLHGAAAPDVQSHSELRTMLDGLPDDLREVVLLKHFAGLTFDQMAISLDENRSTLASRYRKAIEVMQSGASAGGC